MTAISKSTVDAVLKELYRGQAVQELVYDKSARPFLSMVKKVPFAGRHYPMPVIVEDSPGVSPTFATAQSNVNASLLKQFDVDIVSGYSVGRITVDAMLRGASDKGAFINTLKHTVDTAINGLANSIESGLFRDSSGAKGQIGSGYAGTTITLSDPEDIVHFGYGKKVVTAATKTGVLTSGAARTISSVDRDNGTFVINSAFAGTTANGDYLFVEGSHVSSADALNISGLEGWLPTTVASSGDSFFGVDRYADPTRLAGVKYTGNAAAIEESIISGAARLGRESGAVPDVALMSFQVFRRLVAELGSKVQRDAGPKAIGGFQMLEVYGPKGAIKCVPATFCPNNEIFVLTLNTWELPYMGDDVCYIQQHDGLRVRAVYNADELEVRIASYGNLACNSPGKNLKIVLS
jgi:hypothetical protein